MYHERRTNNMGQVPRSSCNDGLLCYSADIDRVHTQHVGDGEGNEHTCGFDL